MLTQYANFFRIAAFKKVKGPEVHEMDRSIFKDRLYSKIYRKKKFNLKKRSSAPRKFDKAALLAKLNRKLEERKMGAKDASKTRGVDKNVAEDTVTKNLKH